LQLSSKYLNHPAISQLPPANFSQLSVAYDLVCDKIPGPQTQRLEWELAD